MTKVCKNISAKVCKNITGKFSKTPIQLDKYRQIRKDLTKAGELPGRERTIKIGVLVGNDYYDDIMKMDKLQIDEGLYIVNSTLGWMFSGRVFKKEITNDEYNMFVQENRDEVENYCDLEAIGIKEKPDRVDDGRPIEMFNKSVTLMNNRYQVSWPWKLSTFELSSNYRLAESRLKLKWLMQSFKSEELKLEYDNKIKKQCTAGIIKKQTRLKNTYVNIM